MALSPRVYERCELRRPQGLHRLKCTTVQCTEAPLSQVEAGATTLAAIWGQLSNALLLPERIPDCRSPKSHLVF